MTKTTLELGSMNARLRFVVYALLLLLTSFSVSSPAQLVATKDLSYSGYSAADVAIGGVYSRAQLAAELESCIKAGGQPHASHSDGITTRIEPETLKLEIVSVEPRPIYEGRELTLVLRILNKGDTHIELPWHEAMVETQSPDESDSPRKSVNYVSIEATVKTHGKQILLKGGVNLQARPLHPQHWITLKPGEWAEIKFLASLVPDPNETPVRPDPRATVWASWSESTFAESRGECSVDSEYYAGGGLRSKPFAVELAKTRK
jgi:hypothetical protein